MVSRSSSQGALGATERTPSSTLDPVALEEVRRVLRLSPRELQIALDMMDGLGHREIARHLRCSPHTVDSHVRRIFRKLRVSNRAGAVGRLFVAYAAWTTRALNVEGTE